jgi:branched-chain amino acid transport system ATP-binding protein
MTSTSTSATRRDATAEAHDRRALLQVRDLRVEYGPHLAVSRVSFDLHRSRALAVLGANGAGKSTLGRALAGLVPSSGSCILDGEDISALPAHEVRRKGLVYIPEGRGVFPSLSVHDNLRMASMGLPRSKRREAIDRAAAAFPVLGQRRDQLAGRLSGGEQQMLSLARVIVDEPSVVIADEISLGLAPLIVEEVFERLQAIRDQGISIILIEQFVHRALSFADDCIIMRRGELDWSGATSSAGPEVLSRYLD